MNANSKKMLSILMVLGVTLFCVSCLNLNAGYEDSIDKSFDVGAGGKLIVDTDIGSIKVLAEGKEGVKVKVIRKARTTNQSKAEDIFSNLKIDFRKSGDDVLIEADYDRKHFKSIFGSRSNLSVRFIVTVPEKYNLDLNTKGGSIEVSEIEGDVKAKTSGGSLKFAFVKGPVQGRTSGGSITLDGCTGDADVNTSGGSITIGEVKGEVKAHTSGGRIKVKEVMGTINAKSSGGSISAYISKQPKTDCSLVTSGGSITAYLAEGIKVNLDAGTSGGHVNTEFPVTIKGKINKSNLKAKINGGGPELYLHTSGGSIHIKEMK
jgi:hypothetical protein